MANEPSRYGTVFPDGIYMFNENGENYVATLPSGLIQDTRVVTLTGRYSPTSLLFLFPQGRGRSRNRSRGR